MDHDASSELTEDIAVADPQHPGDPHASEPPPGESASRERGDPAAGRPPAARDEDARDEDVDAADDEASADSPSAGEPGSPAWTEDQLERAVAAVLFASAEPQSNARLAAALGNTTPAHVATAIDRLSARLVASGLPYELVAIAGGWQMFSARDMSDVVARFSKSRREDKVSPAALETLAVVAYRQPVTKAEIEAVRGVQAGPILRALVDRGLVKVAGRSEDPGHALLYVTTKKFLDTFGLADLQDLPRDAELVRDS